MATTSYESLHILNQAFETITQQLGQLQEAGILTADFLTYEIAVLEERRAGVNYNVTEKLRSQELDNWKAFQDIRLKHEDEQKKEAEGKE